VTSLSLRRRVGNALVGFAFALLSAAPALDAQEQGALFLLYPFGSRAVAMGEAIIADTTLGTEGLWWNVAALSRLPEKELALHHSQALVGRSEMLTFAVPSKVIGTIALGAYVFDYGDQQATGGGGQNIGVITNRNYLLAASYATPVGKRLGLGVTYKFIMLRRTCSGDCGGVSVISGNSSAFDVGGQYALPTPFPVSLGLSLRNIGPALQVKDQAQADPLPRVLQMGAMSRLPLKRLQEAGGSIDVSLDVLSAKAFDGSNVGVGVAAGYLDQYFFRVGYKKQPGELGGPSLGLGIQRGAFGFDLSRRFDKASEGVAEPPTYITLRARF
jgi:hypothetical protein